MFVRLGLPHNTFRARAKRSPRGSAAQILRVPRQVPAGPAGAAPSTGLKGGDSDGRLCGPPPPRAAAGRGAAPEPPLTLPGSTRS